MSSQSGTVGNALTPACQSKIEGKLSASWELLYSLEVRLDALNARLAPVSASLETVGEREQKSAISNDSPVVRAIVSQSEFMEKLVEKIDDISARLEC